MTRTRFAGFVLALSLQPLAFLYAADPFAENVRSTEPLSPIEAERAFRLPPGFKIQLFAAEPEIAKPMNMAFDSQGRLWITDTLEYPFPVPLGKPGRDSIKILEDTNGDGRADKTTLFADGLNIPIGLYPFGQSAVGWSIPNIWLFRDANGDGRSEAREPLYGPFGWERDTHGMNSSFTRGFDGWLYATHGFNNESAVAGRDGSKVQMNSGNTYRVRLDGSRIEHFTWGQVNPFGMCLDPLGNLYTADCHSAPIYQLIRGGYYPSFGKPHDGLGFAPLLMQHSHGSTAISGIAYYAGGSSWPEEYLDNVFVGNVMTSRINRDTLQFKGSSPTAREMPDFLISDDPWFRPVNLQFGPDGALYVADFYNRIIGHYEVPLPHPGRDRHRGRIWRISWQPEKGTPQSPAFNLTQSSPEQLVEELGHPNLTRRLLATHELADRVGLGAVPTLNNAVQNGTVWQKVHALWVLHRLGRLELNQIGALISSPETAVRIHLMRLLGEISPWTPQHRQWALAGLADSNPLVQRAAAEALGLHPAPECALPLARLRQSADPADDHLVHVVRIALRNQLQVPGAFEQFENVSAVDLASFADVSVAIPNASAGLFLARRLAALKDHPKLAEFIQHAARFAPLEALPLLSEFVQAEFPADLELQWTLFDSVQKAGERRGEPLPEPVLAWGRKLATALLQTEKQEDWANFALPDRDPGPNPWKWEERTAADGRTSKFLSSFPLGESQTGILRSPKFVLPPQLSFYLCGQSGVPGQPGPIRNFARVRDAETGQVLAEAPVPRNDVARKIVWQFTPRPGQEARFEVEDGDGHASYAWIAFARLEPDVAPLPDSDPSIRQGRREAALQLVQSLRLLDLLPQLRNWTLNSAIDWPTRAAAAKAWLALEPETAPAKVAASFQAESGWLRDQWPKLLGEVNAAAARQLLLDHLALAPRRFQTLLGIALAGNKSGAELLLKAAAENKIPPQLLLERGIREKIVASGYETQLTALTSTLEPADEKTQTILDERRKAFLAAKPSAEKGAAVFTRNCAPCHQIKGEGALIGPQLDGIGARGLERVLEDLLDPNRNVDHAFRSHLIILKDGDVLSGLPRREEGEMLILADSTGKESAVRKADIAERRESTSSLMPENFGDILPPEELNDLLSFLLAESQNTTAE